MSAHRRDGPRSDVHEEALGILEEAAARGVMLRATGGVAVSLRCPSSARPPLERPYKDIDLVGMASQRREINSLLTELGYHENQEFNLLHGRNRLLYWDTRNGRRLDVFLDRIVMCHALELKGRLSLDELTLPPADLLLTKLQVVETNESDLGDAAALLLDCEIEGGRVAQVLADDWGWWRTATGVLSKIEAYCGSLPGFTEASLLSTRIRALEEWIDAHPKSLRWKARARIGDRVRWYVLPEEEL